MPWIYEKETADVHMSSTYNRKPKKPKIEANEEVRIANIRTTLDSGDWELRELHLDIEQTGSST